MSHKTKPFMNKIDKIIIKVDTSKISEYTYI